MQGPRRGVTELNPCCAERRARKPLRPPFAIDRRARSRRSGSSASTRRRRLIESGLSSHPIDRRSASTSDALSVSSSLAMILWPLAIHARSQQGLKSRIRPSGINFGYRTRRSPSAKRGALRQPALRSTSRRRPPVDIGPACPVHPEPAVVGVAVGRQWGAS